MPLFYALGRERLYAVLSVFQVVVIVPVLVIAAHKYSLDAVAAGRTLVSIFFFIVVCYAASTISSVRLAAIAGVLWRPAVAGIVMSLIVAAMHNDALPGHLLSLICDTILGALTFSICQSCLWVFAGRPEGPEKLIWARIRSHLCH